MRPPTQGSRAAPEREFVSEEVLLLLAELVEVTRDGFTRIESKMDVMIKKQDVMIEKQDVININLTEHRKKY